MNATRSRTCEGVSEVSIIIGNRQDTVEARGAPKRRFARPAERMGSDIVDKNGRRSFS